MAKKDFLDEMIALGEKKRPGFAAKVDAAFKRRVLARRLAELRKKKGITQVVMARRMGSTQPVVSKLESGGDVRLSTLERYAAAMGEEVVYRVQRAKAH